MVTRKASKVKPKVAAKKPVKVVKQVAAKKTIKEFAEKVAEKLAPTHEAVVSTTPDEVVNGADEPVVTVTVAEPVEPPAQLSQLDAIKQAWHNAKDAADPEFDQCAGTFQSDLLYHADAVFKGGQPATDESPLARFERELVKLKGD